MNGLRRPNGTRDEDLSNDIREIRMARRLGDALGVDGQGEIFNGFTTEAIRRERMRKLIGHRSTERVGRDIDGKEVSYAQAFELIYGEKL